jgi:hypothetical protein
MEIKRLTFAIKCINRIFEMNEHSDTSELYLNGVLSGSSDYISREADEPILLQYYGRTHNIADRHTLISVRRRPPRSEAPGIACNEPWTSNDEARDRIRIDGLDDHDGLISIGIFVPPEVYERLYNTNLNACHLYIDAKFLNTGENYLKVDDPGSFLFAYLSVTSVRMVSMAAQNEETENE